MKKYAEAIKKLEEEEEMIINGEANLKNAKNERIKMDEIAEQTNVIDENLNVIMNKLNNK